MGNRTEWTSTVTPGWTNVPDTRPADKLIVRGCEYSFTERDNEIHSPDWFRNIVTASSKIAPTNNGPVFIGFRAVKDKWEQQVWTGTSFTDK